MARRTIKDLFTNNLGYKLIALLLALLLWFDVRTEKVTVIDYPVPVTLSIVGDEMTITNDPPAEVEVSFSGTGRDLLSLDKESLSIQKDVQGGDNDTLVINLDLQDVQRPADLNVTPIGIAPGSIEVVTDRYVEKAVPLQTAGLPLAQAGYEVVDVTVEPSRVLLRGVTAELNGIGSLSLDLEQLSRGPGFFDEQLAIIVPDKFKTVTVTPDSVRIQGAVVPIEEPEPPAEEIAEN
jgi:YbbR domain-containing protein